MGSYEDYANESEQIEHILGLHAVDNYQIEVNNESILNPILNCLKESESVLWADSRKCVQFRATEHNRGYGANARFTLLIVMEVPRPGSKTKITKRRPSVAREQLSIDVGGSAGEKPTAPKKGRNPRLTES